jgi:FkbM family methyltransferase
MNRHTARRIANRLEHRSDWFWKNLASVGLRSFVFDDVVDTMLYALALSNPRAFFIQVGSNDATFGDPLQPFLGMTEWRGIMIEPVPSIFARLVEKQRSRNNRIIFENIAIGAYEGRREFYSVDASGIDTHSWVDQLGSFSRDTILSHRKIIPDIESRLRVTSVECTTLRALCARHSVKRIDLLHVDTEGADLEVLESHDWDSLPPGIVLFEHKHLNHADRAKAEHLLEMRGYSLANRGADTLGVSQMLLDTSAGMGRAWRRSRAPLRYS